MPTFAKPSVLSLLPLRLKLNVRGRLSVAAIAPPVQFNVPAPTRPGTWANRRPGPRRSRTRATPARPTKRCNEQNSHHFRLSDLGGKRFGAFGRLRQVHRSTAHWFPGGGKRVGLIRRAERRWPGHEPDRPCAGYGRSGCFPAHWVRGRRRRRRVLAPRPAPPLPWPSAGAKARPAPFRRGRRSSGGCPRAFFPMGPVVVGVGFPAAKRGSLSLGYCAAGCASRPGRLPAFEYPEVVRSALA